MQSIISIRSAQPSDAAFVSPLICEAMGELVVKFTNGNTQEGLALFEYFFREKNNQYSFENCQIAQYEGRDAGMILAYDGKELDALRQPFLHYLKTHFNTELTFVEDETQAGELYIDCVSVLPDLRGKSIGSALLHAAVQKSQELHLPNTGLLVDVYNEKALKLYQRTGFVVKERRAFAGGDYWHLQYVNP